MGSVPNGSWTRAGAVVIVLLTVGFCAHYVSAGEHGQVAQSKSGFQPAALVTEETAADEGRMLPPAEPEEAVQEPHAAVPPVEFETARQESPTSQPVLPPPQVVPVVNDPQPAPVAASSEDVIPTINVSPQGVTASNGAEIVPVLNPEAPPVSALPVPEPAVVNNPPEPTLSIPVAVVMPPPSPSPESEAPFFSFPPRRGKAPRSTKRQLAQVTPPPVIISPAAPAVAELGLPPRGVYTGRKISLDFKNADIHDVLRILADVSSLNIIATDDVKARVTLRLIEVPWDQALEVILQANGLEKVQFGNVITVSTTKRLEAERNIRLAARTAEQKLAPLETAYVKVNYIKAVEVAALITREAQQRTSAPTAGGARPTAALASAAAPSAGRSGSQVALMSPRGTIAADPTTNIVVIRDVHDNIAAVREMITTLDVQTPQIVIESNIVTANETALRDLGVQWGYRYVASPETGNPTGATFPGRIGFGGSGLATGVTGLPFIADFPASAVPGAGSAIDLALGALDGSHTLNLRLSALEREGKARVISRPRVVTLNNQIAEVRNRREVRVPVVSGALVVGGAGTSGGRGAFEEFDVGVTLKITPQISSDGFVLLNVDVESSEIAAEASILPSGAGSSFPIIRDVLKRTASSNVLIRVGDTFALGGILQDRVEKQDRGIPFLKDVPVIGWLFKGKTNNTTKEELVVFLTPRLAAGVSTASGLPDAEQLWEGRSR